MRTSIIFPILLTLLAVNMASAQSQTGIFLGGDLSLFAINGDGKARNGSERYDLNFSSKIGRVSIAGDMAEVRLDGFGHSKLLVGLRPVVGYRFNQFVTVYAAYDFMLRRSELVTTTTGTFSVTSDSKYWQHILQLVGDFYPGRKNWFVSLGAQYNTLRTDIEFTGDLARGGYKVEGSDQAIGIIFGGGIDIPVYPNEGDNFRFITGAYYSLTNYSGTKLLQINSGGEIDLDMNVGGLMIKSGLRIFFD